MFKKLDFKKDFLPYMVAILVFYAISLIYCSPAIEGQQLFQQDSRNGIGMNQEVSNFQKATGEKSLWTGSMFGGMPTYQISPSYKTFSLMNIRRIFEGGLPAPASYLFLYMIGFFILMCALKVNPWLGMIGGIMFAFSSYFLIIITAGHIWKVWALGLIPPTFAGVIWAYRGNYIKGAAVYALFFTLQLLANHLQMTYYFFVFIGLPYLIYILIDTIRKKGILRFSKATGALLLGTIVAVGVNFTSLYYTAQYSKETIRGKSELTANPENKSKSEGLDKSYATDWSYGVAETFSLLIPDVKGGGNAPIGDKQDVLKNVDPQFKSTVANSDRYWGDQPFTSGPVYVGAFVLFLFIFGLFIVEGGFKWALLASTVLSVLLAWGKNFMPLTNFFLDYFPLYSKFRAVSSILVIAEICIPILAVLALVELIKKPQLVKEKINAFWISAGLTGGLALLFWLFPGLFFNFFSLKEMDQFNQMLQQNPGAKGQLDLYMAGLESARVAILKADAIRSVIIIVLGLFAVWMYQAKKMGKGLFLSFVCVLVLADMWSVDKRYLNDSNFVRKQDTRIPFEPTAADKQIMQDKTLGYRVLNLTVSPFQDASTSYYHRSVGGYHAAKLRRYQDIIDRYFATSINMPVLDMLNARYVIVPDQNKQPVVQQNPGALGAAWFVGGFRVVNNADEEITAIGTMNPANELVVDKRFESQLAGKKFVKDTTSTIKLISYAPNKLSYQTNTTKEQLAVFSEIYYADGWQATIDGKEVPHFRANYILRAMVVPAGKHTIEFRFEPKSFYRSETISVIAAVVLFLLIAAAIGNDLLQARKKRA
ncbi:MAG: YfhO family protein [Bacteroidota bacterium]|nr:YfhO family protein [Bacteroidota bacterium]